MKWFKTKNAKIFFTILFALGAIGLAIGGTGQQALNELLIGLFVFLTAIGAFGALVGNFIKK